MALQIERQLHLRVPRLVLRTLSRIGMVDPAQAEALIRELELEEAWILPPQKRPRNRRGPRT